ncbi:phage head-tail joining protein [Bradyrhizobium arachidis]|uniref:phage head-tail joining protein n=1 Tax=Bradyrhizobium arachidis TaxID=858423 RepID=UPI0021617F01|nr:hypothetical protein [Bradyrhizobium arachidis]UVO29920.1 hypothetical protein KUF59_03915 [Bradyrhizobium arachidis]
MADLATLQANLEHLKDALTSGSKRVRYEGPNGAQEVEYRSVNDLLKAIAATEQEIAALQGTAITTINIRSKGWQ